MVHTQRVNQVLRMAVLLAMSALVLMPILAVMLGGFKTLPELRSAPLAMPEVWRTETFADILQDTLFWRYMLNSLVIAISTVGLTLVTGSMAAFVFAHIRFAGSNFLLSYLLLGLMFPVAAAIIPLFLQIRDVGLLDTHLGVILPQVAFGLGFATLLFKTFFDDMPPELFEAAQMDGCGYIRFFFIFTLPLSLPVLATVATFVFVTSWNNYLLPLVVLNVPETYPWTVGMMQFSGEYVVAWNRILAFVTLTLLPAVLFFFVAQKFIVAGLTQGALKG